MPLLDLPNEIILLIAGFLSVRDLNSFLRVNSQLTYLLTPILHKHAILDIDGESALAVAAKRGYEGLARIVISKGANVNFQNKGSLRTALHYAAEAGNATMAKLLLDNGADISMRCCEMTTALHWAAFTKDSETTLKILLEGGADPTAQDRWGRTPLRWAIDDSSEAVIRLLLEYGADATAQPSLYCSTNMLQEACGLVGKEWVVKLMLENGADLSAVDTREGGAALHWAARAGREGVVRLLLENGADVDAKDFAGGTAVDWARRIDSNRRTKRNMRIRTCTTVASSRSWGDVIKVLLDSGASLTQRLGT